MSTFLSTLPARGATILHIAPTLGRAIFLSTLPARGATRVDVLSQLFKNVFLSTLPARGATWNIDPFDLFTGISIHAPREGSDAGRSRRLISSEKFLSTLPARGATSGVAHHIANDGISIHAPREGSDWQIRSCPCLSNRHFYPRSPRGERPTRKTSGWMRWIFLSTLPARGATPSHPATG